MGTEIKGLIKELSKSPENLLLNFEVAQKYEALNQWATAVSFYLKCAEYSMDSDENLCYYSLIRIGMCLEKQRDRNSSVSNVFLQAIDFLPNRPEAYLSLCKFYERNGENRHENSDGKYTFSW